MEKEHLELIKELTKNKNNSISFRISKEDDDLLNKIVEELNSFSGAGFSKSSFIRTCIFKGRVICIGLENEKHIMEKQENSKIKIFTTDVIESYGIHNLIKLLEKKSKNFSEKQKQYEKVSRIRISGQERLQIERGIIAAKMKTGIVNISLGDFVRFCIESELRVKRQEIRKKNK